VSVIKVMMNTRENLVSLPERKRAAASVPMTYTLAVKIQHGLLAYRAEDKLEVLSEKGSRRLPHRATQTSELAAHWSRRRTTSSQSKFYEMADDIDTQAT